MPCVGLTTTRMRFAGRLRNQLEIASELSVVPPSPAGMVRMLKRGTPNWISRSIGASFKWTPLRSNSRSAKVGVGTRIATRATTFDRNRSAASSWPDFPLSGVTITSSAGWIESWATIKLPRLSRILSLARPTTSAPTRTLDPAIEIRRVTTERGDPFTRGLSTFWWTSAWSRYAQPRILSSKSCRPNPAFSKPTLA